MSKRRQREAKEYARMRADFLRQRPLCQAHAAITGEAMVFAASTDVHHMEGRHGGNYLDRDTWLAVCRECHRWIHDHPKQAKEKQLLK